MRQEEEKDMHKSKMNWAYNGAVQLARFMYGPGDSNHMVATAKRLTVAGCTAQIVSTRDDKDDYGVRRAYYLLDDSVPVMPNYPNRWRHSREITVPSRVT